MKENYLYVIISPVRDEEKYIAKTISSVVLQNVLPLRYIIVDDGSRDGTGAIIDDFAKRYSWITAIHRKDRGFRNSAGGEVDAFYDGFQLIENDPWDFVVKLDGDLSFEPDYFEKCFSFFDAAPTLGIGSGEIVNLDKGRLFAENDPDFHVRGAAKMYKRECWDALGGMYPINGWDTLDEVKANMLGWKTRCFSSLKIIQHRPTGKAVGSWKNAVKNGLGAHVAGYHPLYMAAKCIKRLFEKPYIVESVGLMFGFVKGAVTGLARVDDGELIRYLRCQQLRRLFLLPTIWK